MHIGKGSTSACIIQRNPYTDTQTEQHHYYIEDDGINEYFSINYMHVAIFYISDEMVISSNKHLVQNIAKSSFESKMILTIKKLQMNDLGGYRCIAKNSLGEVDSNIRLYGKYSYSIFIY